MPMTWRRAATLYAICARPQGTGWWQWASASRRRVCGGRSSICRC